MDITFKENIADIRNSKAIAVVKELQQYSIDVYITTPFASPDEVSNKYHLPLNDVPFCDFEAIIVAVNHTQYTQLPMDYFTSIMLPAVLLLDLKGIYPRPAENGLLYWRL